MTRAPPHDLAAFAPWLERWHLVPAGAPSRTRTGRFLAVTFRGEAALLKVVTEPEEKDGSRVLAWWEGEGAARVLARSDDAVVLERALGSGSLTTLAHRGRDAEASTILCRVAATLHAKDPADRPDSVVPLKTWFRALWPPARSSGGILAHGAAVAKELLAGQDGTAVVLHGDLHHENVLDFGAKGWLAIDPKGLYGERTFDYVNLLRNPDPGLALAPGRFESQVAVIAQEADLDPHRLLLWTLAFACLSAAWILNDGDDPAHDLAVAELARVALAGGRGDAP